MKAILLPALFSLALACTLTAQTCREVVPDASGRIVQTIDRQKSAGGTMQATTRDASGRIISTATTNPNASPSGSFTGTQRDASGRLIGSSTGSGKCQGVTKVPVPPPATKRQNDGCLPNP
ncbi:hypothetical protein HQ447_17040 [bacterium]|nr:hypothetical protein [bacterium]